MKEKAKNIEIGKGFGAIRFGMDRDEIKKIAGEPDEIEKYQHDDIRGEDAEAWHYDEPEVSFAFEEFNDWKLTSIAISSPEFKLGGKELIGLKVDEVINILKPLGLGEIVQEDCSTDETPDLHLVTVEESGLNLWFDEGLLTEIQWSPIWDDEDEVE